MTNKINGIDVSRCKHYDIDNNYCDQSYLGEGGLLKNTKNPKKCEQSPNCYFKQLKRLQKENEELKAENKNYAKLMLEQQEISRKYWECIEKIKQAIEVLAETCNVYPLKTNLDKLITKINEVLNDRN